jgi:Fur family ferric uptake transcriptional regulator
MENQILGQSEQQSYRLTKVGKAILTLLEKTCKPLAPLEIQAALAKQGLVVNKTTIYRQLDSLQSQDLLEEILFPGRVKHYELRGPHHHHLICLHCQAVEDVVLRNDLAVEEAHLSKDSGFKIMKHYLEFFGLCRVCQQQKTVLAKY